MTRYPRNPIAAECRDHDSAQLLPDWHALGERLRRAARVATVLHLVELGETGRERGVAVESSPGKRGG